MQWVSLAHRKKRWLLLFSLHQSGEDLNRAGNCSNLFALHNILTMKAPLLANSRSSRPQTAPQVHSEWRWERCASITREQVTRRDFHMCLWPHERLKVSSGQLEVESFSIKRSKTTLVSTRSQSIICSPTQQSRGFLAPAVKGGLKLRKL